ncbi:MAG: UbiX family flavin prenyltransferase [Candidatus Hadarchaeales archaeon]
MHLIVALTGSSGVVYGVRFLEVCRELGIETDLILSEAGKEILRLEMGKEPEEVEKLASRKYGENELTSPLSSGSYEVDGMVIVPCSMKTLACVANGISGNLITRAADVMLKQGKPLVLVPRETPLSLIHLENMLKAKRAGAVVLPACPAFYHGAKNLSDLVDFIVGKILDVLGIKHRLYRRWGGG